MESLKNILQDDNCRNWPKDTARSYTISRKAGCPGDTMRVFPLTFCHEDPNYPEINESIWVKQGWLFPNGLSEEES